VCAVPHLSRAETQVWLIAADRSTVRISVGKSGLFGGAGHTHEVVAPALSGSVQLDPGSLQRAGITLTFDASALRVTGEGEPAKDVPEVQRVMLSEKVLDVAKYPTILFQSRQIDVERDAGGQAHVRVTGDMTLHGVTRRIDVPVDVTLGRDDLTGTGTLTIKQTEFGITPVSAGLGTVKVRDEVSVSFAFTARRKDDSGSFQTAAPGHTVTR
jgi:polyisoprenoid-binding protein YceI